MQKIGDITDTATADGEFTDGNVAGGTQPTELLAAIFNTWQRELCNVVVGSGRALDPENDGQLLTAISSLISTAIATVNIVPDIDELYITRGKTDPNVKYAGTTWEYLGEGLTLRTAKADLSDLGIITGADTAPIAVANLPSHTHSIGGSTGSSTASTLTTSPFDYGTKASNSAGAHTHTISSYDPGGNNSSIAAAEADGSPVTNTTSSAGAHTHTTAIGSHTHTGTIPAHSHTLPAATGAAGSGTAISILQKSIMVAVWVRTA